MSPRPVPTTWIQVRLSSRLVDSPVIVVGHESSSMRRMMTMVESGQAPVLPPQTLEINGGHPIIVSLAAARQGSPELATVVAKQLFNNALITAGLLDDPRTMLPNINALMTTALRSGPAEPELSKVASEEPASTTAEQDTK